MTSRRNFLQQTGAMALGALFLPRLGRASSFLNSNYGQDIGLQLYTISDLMAADPKGTLKKVAAIGYKELESASTPKGYYYGYRPKEFAAIAKSEGLHWRSHHVLGAPFDLAMLKDNITKLYGNSEKATQIINNMNFLAKLPTLDKNYQQLADEAAEGGVSYLVCATIPVETLDQIKRAADVFNKTGEACKKVGVQFAYHNHTTEFDTIEGHRPFDYILSNTDKNLVKMELDLGWATKAGQDPVALFKQHPGRFPLWHAKDIDKSTKAPAIDGTGIVDFKRIFENAKESGMKYFFVEQDQAPHPMEDIKQSYGYLHNLLL
jgi:sugar phosphate isomerase/epimerase